MCHVVDRSAALLALVLGVAGCGASPSAASPLLIAADERPPDEGPPDARPPDGRPPDAIQCFLYAQTSPRLGSYGRSSTRTLTVAVGEHASLTLGKVTLEMSLEPSAFGVWVKTRDAEVFRTLYQFGTELPANRFFGDHGFTGLVYLVIPGEPDGHQLSCHSMVMTADPDRESHEAERREQGADARRATWKTTLDERVRCALTVRDREAGARCPPKHPLQARVDAIIALHKMGQRKFPAVSLEGGNLARVDLRESNLQEAQLAGANLQEAMLFFDDLERADLERANLERANLYAASLIRANLRDTKLDGAKLQVTRLHYADLTRATLTGAYLMDATLEGTIFSDANLERAHLEGARLAGAKFDGANVERAQFDGAVLDGTDLSGARNLTQRQLKRACGDAATRLPEGLTIDRAQRPCVPGMDYTPCVTAESAVAPK